MGVISGIRKANGIRGFYRGIHIASIKAAPSIYIQLLFYDYLKGKSLLGEKEPSMELMEKTFGLGEAQEPKTEGS